MGREPQGRSEAGCPPWEGRGHWKREIASDSQEARDLAEGSLYRALETGDFAPLQNMVAGTGATANMADIGLHLLKSWTLPLASGAHGILGEDF